MKRSLALLATLELLASIAGISSSELKASDGDARPATAAVDPYAQSADAFLNGPAANRSIDDKDIDTALLRAALFHQTNRVRAEHKLALFSHARPLEEAAQMHADDMVAGHFFAHENPNDPSRRTMLERVKLEGYDPRYVAENLATQFVIQYESGRSFYVVPGGVSYEPDGKPIPPHTYASFAAAVLESWMNSPGHRHNILAIEPRELGTGAAFQPSMKEGELAKFACVQEFGTPMPQR